MADFSSLLWMETEVHLLCCKVLWGWETERVLHVLGNDGMDVYASQVSAERQ